MSTSWFVVADGTIIWVSDLITSTTQCYRLACVEEMYGCLDALQRIDKIFVHNKDATQINLYITSDCLGFIWKLEKDSKVVSMHTKLYPIIK